MKKFTTILLTLALILTLTACLPNDFADVNDKPNDNLPAPATKEELYSLYDAIERDMTRSEIEAKFGTGEPKTDNYGDVKYINYYNEKKSAGVSVIYDDGIVETKMLFFNSKKNLVPFSGRYIDEKIPEVKSDMTVENAIKIMGSAPLELSCTYDDDGPLDMDKIYCWYNEDASNFMLHTENGIIENVALYRN
ncbi:MAG: hypothetical protein IJB42_01715 [Oscillospiraceae bacterium]|nr:hypothetical protein [Oscillospiraceae bacterium]MBQ2741680.1 hypothetical protein [Oscillospiraceae bacterium]MBQ3224404.1 hypothetical protein [Oscillospiraceae bacterium]MBQ4315747.1 hypothetical protein [Oscillospiraceae bacterium]MBQ6698858.1 hypothetical protein [Oscillospiraceae bacterium]